MSLPAAKLKLVAQVFAAAPNDALQRLELVLDRARLADPTLEPVHALATAESKNRHVVAVVFEPILPMSERAPPPRRILVSREKLAAAWRAVAAADPGAGDEVLRALKFQRREDGPPPILDDICLRAAETVADDPALVELLRLTPLLRRVQARLGAWSNNLSSEAVASLRVAFKDALEIDEAIGPLFWEAILAMLDEPWRVIRLISAANDRPSDRYLAASELAGLCERLLDDVDSRVAAIKRFDPERGEEGGAAAAASIQIAVQIIAEFEGWLALNREGPWGRRIAEQKKALSLSMEGCLRDAEPAVAAALPTQPIRGAGKSARPAPKLLTDPQPLQVNRAEAYLALMNGSRPSASAGGFASLRAKVTESLEVRLAQYCEDLIDLLREGEHAEPDRIRAYLEIAAHFTGLIQGPKGAQIIRRRAAAA